MSLELVPPSASSPSLRPLLSDSLCDAPLRFLRALRLCERDLLRLFLREAFLVSSSSEESLPRLPYSLGFTGEKEGEAEWGWLSSKA